MKLLATFVLLALFYTELNAQKWGANTFGQFTNEALDVEIDNAGNSYITGYVTGETAFNTANVVQNAAGNGDVYVAKYDENGNFLWYKKFGGNYSDRAYDLAIGPDQNIVVTGQFFGSITFGSTTLQSEANSKDIFLLKLDPNGNVIWALKEGGSMAENAYGVAVDNQNNIILTGQFQGNATIAGSNFTSMIDPISNLPSFDLFISKYDPLGNPLWVLNGAAEKEDRGLAVAVDSQDNIFLTGQYSDTLLFAGNTYNNNGYNVGFVSKISPFGQVQFFNNLRAGFVLPYDVEVNSDDKVVITGDFLGNMNYYHNNQPNYIQNPYNKKIFILTIENSGQYVWNYTLGSESDISATSVSIDPDDNVFVTGFFSCALNQLHDTVPALWNSVGFKDPYVLKVSGQGNFIYAKQMGGKMDDVGHGIAVKSADKPILCGGFTKDMNIAPTSDLSVISANSNYKLRQFFGEVGQFYFTGDSTRNSFLLKYVDVNYLPYNYYEPQTADSLVGAINNDIDTIHFCRVDVIGYNTLTWNFFGPSYSYLWNNGANQQFIDISNTGNFSVAVSRNDGCATDIDSIYMISDPIPVLPLLSDDVVQYTNHQADASGTYGLYNFCYPNPIVVYYTNLAPGTTMITYQPSNGSLISGTGPNTHSLEGGYNIVVDNGMCQNVGYFAIDYDYSLPHDDIDPQISSTSAFVNDSITICRGQSVNFFAFDLITNPLGNYQPFQEPVVSAYFTINGNVDMADNNFSTAFVPVVSGTYLVEFDIILGFNNLCGIDTSHYYVQKPYYIEVLPLPNFNASIIGDNLLCENGSVFLTISNTNSNLNWSGPGISWLSSDNDSIEINLPGVYSYSGAVTDSITGCNKWFNFSKNITLKQAPNIISNPSDGIICPNDTAILSLPNIYQTYQWVGPDGDTISILNTCEGMNQGFYYCHVLDDEGCNLTTPPFELKEFTTPSVSVFPQNFICDNETVTISINYTGLPSFQWSPIASTADELVVTQPGNYNVTIEQCGITVTENITIIDASFVPIITSTDTLICFGEELAILGNITNAAYQWTNGESSSGSLTVNQAGSFSATVTNDYGCVEQSNTIHISSVAGSFPPPMDSLVICIGSDVNLIDSSNFDLNWYDLDTNFLQTTSSLLIPSIQSDTAFLIAYDIEFCQPVFKHILIDVVDSLSAYSLSADTMICAGENITLFLDHSPTANFEWFNGDSINDEVIVNQPGFYAISIQECGYAITNSIEIHDASFEALLVASDTLICGGEIISISTIPTDATNVVWNSTTQNPLVLDVTQPGIYFATVTNAYGCADESDTITISLDSLSIIPFVLDTTICAGSDFALQDTSLMMINWYTADTILITTSTNFQIAGLFSDTSFIYSQSSNACSITYQTVYLNVVDSIVDLEILGDSVLCPNEESFFHVSSNENVVWSTPNQVLGANTYINLNQSQLQNSPTITASFSNQCFSGTFTDSIFYVQPEIISVEDESILLCRNETVTLDLLQDVASVTWYGNFGAIESPTLPINTQLGSGTISAIAVDLNGCTTNSIYISVIVSELDFTINTNSGNNCLGEPGYIQINTIADSLIWSTPNGTTQSTTISFISNQNSNGLYQVSMWDNLGCQLDSVISISYNSIPTFDLNSDTLLCINDIYTYVFPSDTVEYTWSVYGETSNIPITGNQELVLTATSSAGCTFSDTLFVVTVNCDDALPNFVTSNGDGINDYFYLDEASLFPNNHLYLYNRWGNVIFEQEGYQNTFEGARFSEGVYWYVFYQDPINNPEKVKQGFLHIYH
jgi:gliding motility-associated-like protein